MISSAFPHPDDRSIIVHAWGRDAGHVAANAGRFIPWSHTTRTSKGWRLVPSGRPRWRYINLEVMSILGDLAADHLRAVAVYAMEFERMIRAAIGGGPPRKGYLIRIFADKKAFCTHATICSAANAMSFYDPRSGEIAMWFDGTMTDEELQGLLAHEFTHAYMDLVWNRTSPLWFAEGMAEYFQSFAWEAGAARPGQVGAKSLELLQPAPPMDLPGFVRIPRDVMYSSPEFPRLYAQAWSVVHFLFSHDPALIFQLLGGRGVDVAALEPAWRGHLDLLGTGAVPEPRGKDVRMTRAEFTRKWAKKVTSQSAIEEFERDVESMAYATARSVITGVTTAIKKVRRVPRSREAKVLSMVADNLLPAVEKAFMEFYNGPEPKK